jgi:tRNA1(Val) A37 N6-methylase TrmN6
VRLAHPSAGEILYSGVSRILDTSHLDASNACTLFDLGSGCGRLCMQAFLQFKNLDRVVGVEVRAREQHTALRTRARKNCHE